MARCLNKKHTRSRRAQWKVKPPVTRPRGPRLVTEHVGGDRWPSCSDGTKSTSGDGRWHRQGFTAEARPRQRHHRPYRGKTTDGLRAVGHNLGIQYIHVSKPVRLATKKEENRLPSRQGQRPPPSLPRPSRASRPGRVSCGGGAQARAAPSPPLARSTTAFVASSSSHLLVVVVATFAFLGLARFFLAWMANTATAQTSASAPLTPGPWGWTWPGFECYEGGDDHDDDAARKTPFPPPVRTWIRLGEWGRLGGRRCRAATQAAGLATEEGPDQGEGLKALGGGEERREEGMMLLPLLLLPLPRG
ncbi:unnamed protein product [Lampetra fluviatilis]